MRGADSRIPREEFRRSVPALMDEAPEWRDRFARQLELLDLEYDPHHWIEMDMIR